MIKIERFENRFTISSKNETISCETLPKLIKVMLALGIDEREVQYGLEEFLNGDDILDYGINKKFIYSKKQGA